MEVIKGRYQINGSSGFIEKDYFCTVLLQST